MGIILSGVPLVEGLGPKTTYAFILLCGVWVMMGVRQLLRIRQVTISRRWHRLAEVEAAAKPSMEIEKGRPQNGSSCARVLSQP